MSSRENLARLAARFQAEWRLILAAGEVLWLVAAAAVEMLLLRRVTSPSGGPLQYTALAAAVLAGGYLAARIAMSVFYRRSATRLPAAERAELPRAGDLMDEFDDRRVTRAAMILAAVLLCHAFFSGPAWMATAVLLAGVLTALEYSVDRDGRELPARPVAEEELATDPKLAAVARLAREQGREDVELMLHDEPMPGTPAVILPGGGPPRIWLSAAAVDDLSSDELRAAAAHELAHLESRHPRRRLLATAGSRLVSVAGLCELLWLTRAPGRPAATAALLPTAALGWYLLRAAGTIAEKAHRRAQERQAHRRAVEMTGDAAGYLGLMAKLSPGPATPPDLAARLLSDAPDRAQVERSVRAAASAMHSRTKRRS